MGCIYYHKNKINGHMYIGQSICNSTNIKYGRWGATGTGYKANSYFWHAIKKYGWENFEHGFFEDNIDNELLNEKEKYYIALYHTYRQDPEYKSGYNLTPGGEGSMNTWWPEEDAWLIENYDRTVLRDDFVKKFKKAFPDNYHTDAAIKSRLKKLRLSNIENVNFWKPEEDNLLKEVWPVLPSAEVLKLFPERSLDNLRKRANMLGLTRQVDCAPDYSESELQILKDFYTDYGPLYCQKQIRGLLGVERTFQSVRSRAARLGLKHQEPKFSEAAGFDLEKFKAIYYSDGVKACMESFNITEAQVRYIAGVNKFLRNKATIEHYDKKILCVELNMVFNGCRAAAIGIGKKDKNFSNIYQCCRGQRKTAYGYHWKFIEGEN